MQAHHVLRALGEGGNFVNVQRGSVRCQDGTGLHYAVEFFEHFFLDANVLKHGLNHHVGAAQVVVAQGGGQKRHALLVFVLLELAFFDLRLVVAAHDAHAFVQGFLLHFQHLDRNASVQEVHGNAAAHGARTDDGHALDLAQWRVRGHIRNFRGGPLAQEQVAQGTALRAHHQADENIALDGQAVVKLLLGSGLDRVHALERRRQVFDHRAHTVAHKLKESVAHGVAARQVAHQRQGPGGSDRMRQIHGLLRQGVGRLGHFVKQFLARQHGQHFALDGLARDHHIDGGLYAQNTRQALRTTRAGQQTELDFGQRNAGARCGDTVVATQRQLQAAAHGHRMDGGHDGLGGVLDHADHAAQVGLLHGLGRTKLANIGPTGKRSTGAGNDDGDHRRIRHGLL